MPSDPQTGDPFMSGHDLILQGRQNAFLNWSKRQVLGAWHSLHELTTYVDKSPDVVVAGL